MTQGVSTGGANRVLQHLFANVTQDIVLGQVRPLHEPGMTTDLTQPAEHGENRHGRFGARGPGEFGLGPLYDTVVQGSFQPRGGTQVHKLVFGRKGH